MRPGGAAARLRAVSPPNSGRRGLAMTTVAEPPRVVIEEVTPSVDGGRYPVKLPFGSTLEVGVNVFRDGHDLVAARVIFLPPGEPQWRSASLTYQYDVDRWFGSFQV